MAPRNMQSWLPWAKTPLIISAPMFGTANAKLAFEVSKAGGFGIIPAGFNFSAGSAHLEALEGALAEACELFGLANQPGSTLPVGVGFITSHPSIQNFAQTALPILRKYKPTAVWLFAQDPDVPQRPHPAIIQELRRAGIKAIVQVGTVVAAREAVEDGADVLVAQGIDAGGHQFARGSGIISLVPEIRDLIETEYPNRHVGLVAAGGIADGRGVAAALALGAEAVCLGTRFIVATESSAAEFNRKAILEAKDGGAITVKTPVLDDIQGTPIWPALYDGRAIIGPSYKDYVSGLSLEANIQKYKDALQAGDSSRRTIWCGTGVGLVKDALPAGDIVESLRKEALAVSRSLLPSDDANL